MSPVPVDEAQLIEFTDELLAVDFKEIFSLILHSVSFN
jgi:hypothetical protein